MMASRLVSTVRFISARRVWPSVSARVISARVASLLVVLRQELGGGDEQRAGQAGVGVWTRFLQRQTAISVGQSHFRARQVLFHPGGVGERTVGAGVDGLAANVDLLSAFSLFADGGVGEARVAGGHGMAGVVEQATHHFQRHVVVETGWRRCAGTGGV
jgi:hypothetical protein